VEKNEERRRISAGYQSFQRRKMEQGREGTEEGGFSFHDENA
jgi:hypothetical protein